MIGQLGGSNLEIYGGFFASGIQAYLFPGQQYAQPGSSRSRNLLGCVFSCFRPYRFWSGCSAFQNSPGSSGRGHVVWAALRTFDLLCIHHHAPFGRKNLGEKRRTFFDGTPYHNDPLSSLCGRTILRTEQHRGFNKHCRGNRRRVIFTDLEKYRMVQIKDPLNRHIQAGRDS